MTSKMADNTDNLIYALCMSPTRLNQSFYDQSGLLSVYEDHLKGTICNFKINGDLMIIFMGAILMCTTGYGWQN